MPETRNNRLIKSMRCLLFLMRTISPSLAMAADVSFRNQLVPILARRCLGCHDNRKTEGRFALHTFEQMLKPGDSGERPIVPGSPKDSYLFKKLGDTRSDSRGRMERSHRSHRRAPVTRRSMGSQRPGI